MNHTTIAPVKGVVAPAQSACVCERCADCRRRKRRIYLRAWCKRNRHRTRMYGQRYARKRGVRPRAEVDAARRARTENLAPKLELLIAEGHSYTTAGARHGLTRNAVAGMLHRWRNQAEVKP